MTCAPRQELAPSLICLRCNCVLYVLCALWIGRQRWLWSVQTDLSLRWVHRSFWSCSGSHVPEPPRDKTNKMACAPSEDSDKPWHPPSLIRVFAVRMKKARVLSYPLSAQRRLWSDWADAQADLSLRWAHMSVCWVCHEVVLPVYSVQRRPPLLNQSRRWSGRLHCASGLSGASSCESQYTLLGSVQHYTALQHISRSMTKPTRSHERQAKTRISLCTRIVWSECSL